MKLALLYAISYIQMICFAYLILDNAIRNDNLGMKIFGSVLFGLVVFAILSATFLLALPVMGYELAF